MNPAATLLVFAKATSFKGAELTSRYLQEKGLSPARAFALQRYALIPAVIWAAIFIRADDVERIINTPHLLVYFVILALFWNIQQFLTNYLLNSVSSMSAFSTLQHLLLLPLLLVIGTFFNHDTPNVYSIVAVATLFCAFAIQPSQHADNKRTRFSMPLAIIVGLVALQTILDAVDSGLYRELLKTLRPEIVLGVFSVLTLSLCWTWTPFMIKQTPGAEVARQRWRRAALIPTLWFAGSIPEAYAVAILPIYISVSIGAFTFTLDTLSDIFHHRISLSPRTLAFILLVLSGIGLAIYSS